MKPGCFALALLASAALSLAGEPSNLLPQGDFEAPAKALRQVFTGKRGRLTFVREEVRDNHCAKVEILKITKDKGGIETAAAALGFKVPVKAGKRYRISFDATGTAPRFMFHLSQEGKRLPLTMVPPLRKGASYLENTPDWKEYAGVFKATADGEVHVTISLWHSTRHGKMFYAVGDYLLVDNLVAVEQVK